MNDEYEALAKEYPKMREQIEKTYENHINYCVSPYKELHCGCESIYDYVDEKYTVPDKVIAYLKTTKPRMMRPGVYEHPFIKGRTLPGPYQYTDGNYYWDRDTWKYVVKYHVTIPQKFVDYVMSDEGTKYLEEFYANPESWSAIIKEWKKGSDGCLLPSNAGDIDLDDF